MEFKNLANHHQIKFNHHRADADAEVCAKISLLAFEIIHHRRRSKKQFSVKFKRFVIEFNYKSLSETRLNLGISDQKTFIWSIDFSNK